MQAHTDGLTDINLQGRSMHNLLTQGWVTILSIISKQCSFWDSISILLEPWMKDQNLELRYSMVLKYYYRKQKNFLKDFKAFNNSGYDKPVIWKKSFLNIKKFNNKKTTNEKLVLLKYQGTHKLQK